MCKCTPSRSVCPCEEPKEEHKQFDPTKPVQTRDGRKARIVSTDRKWSTPILAFITCSDGKETYQFYLPNGSVSHSLPKHPSDLVNISEKRWVNIYRNANGYIYAGGRAYSSKKDAIAIAQAHYEFSKQLLACIEIDWPE